MNNRQAFEAWYEVDCYPCEHSNWFRRDSDGDYEFDEVQYAWRTWQAATAAALDRAAKVCDAIAHDWRGANSQSIQCADAIRALKDADTC